MITQEADAVRGPKVTILDVARRAGVAVGTVSYVLSGTRNVSDARRRRVLAAIGELNYRPNILAQGLRRGHSRLVGVCLPDTTSAFFAQLTESLEGIAAARGYEMVQVLSHQDPELQQRRLAALLAYRLAGLLLVPTPNSEASFALLTQTGLATIILDRTTGDTRFDEVTIDNDRAMQGAVNCLLAQGHRRLLYIVSYPALITTRQRIAAFHRTALAAGPDVAHIVMERGTDEAVFAPRLTAALSGPGRPTALIASNTTVGMWVIRALQPLGLEAPRDLSLLIFDHPDWADIMHPRLAVIEHPTGEMAALAWDLLERRMQDGDAARQQILLQTELVLRPSIGPPPAS